MVVIHYDHLRTKVSSELEKRQESLPMLPMVVARIAEMDADDDNFVEAVEELAHCDPTFMARLIKKANTGMFKQEKPALTIERCIVRVGALRLADMVRLHSVMRTFVPTNFGQRFLWFHTLEVAEGARLIANALPGGEINPDVAYAAGMLHDIGRLVMFADSPDELGTINESFWTSFDELQHKEREICGYDHAELGGLALNEWGLPKVFADLVRDHHSREKDLSIPITDRQKLLLRVVQCADNISLVLHDEDLHQVSAQPRCNRLREKLAVYGWDRPPLTAAKMDDLFATVETEASRKAESIGIRK